MLDELSVTNLGVIGQARIEPGLGMVVVTGETGAGKTMLLGALRLLIGGNARSDLIGPEGDEASVEGRFILDGEELVVARRMTDGRSRAYLDGSMVSARAIADRLGSVVDIVGQHDQLALTRSGEARRLVDTQLETSEPLEGYQAAWDDVTALRHAQQQLGGDRRSLERERDLLAFQAEEIEQGGFVPGDDVSLEQSANRMRNAERIGELVSRTREALESARHDVGDAVAAMRQTVELDESIRELLERIEGLAAELAEAAADARQSFESVEHDPEGLEAVEQRLTLLGEFRRKYGSDLEEILTFQSEAARRHLELTRILEKAETVDADLASATQQLETAGTKLRAARVAAADRLSTEAVVHLIELGFNDPVVAIEVREGPAGPDGADKVEIQFASDSRLTPGPVARVASGGELSRLILSLRLASESGTGQIVAFDEIDTGVGGVTALAMGAKLASLAKYRQVLCVTHLPQVAAYGDAHFVVERDGPNAVVRQVSGDARIEELSRMLSGLPDSERGRDHAEELRALAMQARS